MKPSINLIFPAGGTLLLPDGFQTLCTALGVAVTIVESEDQLFGVLRHLNERPDVERIGITKSTSIRADALLGDRNWCKLTPYSVTGIGVS